MMMRTAGAVWSPLDLSPEGWWRADLGHAHADTDPMSGWANQGTAGSSGDLQQGTGGNQPVYDASHASFNGQAVVTFDGGDVLYATAGTWWHLASESSSACVIAVTRTTSASGAEEVMTTRTALTTGGFRLRAAAAGVANFAVSESGGATDISDNGGSITQNVVHVIAGVLTGATTATPDSAACWVGGASSAATTGDMDAAVASSSNREWCVGGTATTTGAYTGQLAELIFIKRALTAPEDAELTTYLNARYGLALSGVTQ